MAFQRFHLLGAEPSTAKEVAVPTSASFKKVQIEVAKALDITTYKSVSFTTSEGDVLEKVEDVVEHPDAVAVAIDGHAIRKPQGPAPLPVVGNYYEIYPDHLHNHGRLFRKYGDVIKTEVMGKVVYLTNSPSVSEQILIESPYFSKEINSNHPLYGIRNNDAVFLGDTNKNWVVGHKYASASMTGKAIPHYAKMTHNELVKVLGVLDTLDARNESFNAYSLTLKIASQVIGKFTLMRDLHHLDSPESPLDDLVTDMVALLGYNKQVTSRGEWFGKLPFGPGKHLRDSSGHFHELLEKQLQLIKDDHEKNPRPDLDLETAAMDADCLADFFLRAADENGDKIPHDLMLANLGVLVGAGFTTTSSAMAWLLYALAKYPDCQDKMLQELVDNDITKDTEFTPAVLEKLTYLEKFLKETLRMHGPSFAPGRTAQVDNVVLPGGYVLNKGDVVISALYSIHYHPKIWNNPERFDPERWTPDFKPSRYEYMPFAAGGRSCIGFAFALQELRLFLATIVRYYDICQVGDEPIEYDPEFQLIRPTNLYIRAKRRPE